MVCTAQVLLKVRLVLVKICYSQKLIFIAALERQYVTWLNNESLEFGGRLVNFPPLQNREIFSYYANQEWEFVRLPLP